MAEGSTPENRGTDNSGTDNSAKNIIKNIGNLNKEIIKALVNAQKVKNEDNPDTIDHETVKLNLGTFSTLIGNKGSLSGILSSIGSLNQIDASTSTSIAASIMASKTIVGKIGQLVDAIRDVKDKTVDKTLSLDNAREQVVGTLKSVKGTLENFEGNESGLLTYFKLPQEPETEAQGDPNQRPAKKKQSEAQQKISQINNSISAVKSLITSLVKSYSALDKDDFKTTLGNVDTVSKTISDTILGEKGVIKKIAKSILDIKTDIENSGLDDDVLNYFIGNKKAEDAIGELSSLEIKKVVGSVTKDNDGNDVVTEIQQAYIKNSSGFGSIITRIKTALTAIKQTKQAPDNYVKLFGQKVEDTIKTIDDWSAGVQSVREKWGVLFGSNSVTEKIKNSIEEAAAFKFELNSVFVKKLPPQIDKTEGDNVGENKAGKKKKPKAVSEFEAMLTNIKDALGIIKNVKQPLNTYIGIFAEKNGPNTTGRIKHWQNAVTPIYQRWGLVFGKGSLTDMIVDSVNIAASFNPRIPGNLDKDKGENGKSLFAIKMDKLKAAVNEIKKITKVTDAFINLFASKNPVLSSEAHMQVINNNVKKSANTLKSQILGSGGAMSKVLAVLTDVVINAKGWVIDDFFKGVAQKDTEGKDVLDKKGNVVMKSPFTIKVDEVKGVVTSIKKLGDIFKEVDKATNSLRDSLNNGYFANIGWLHKTLLDGKKGPIQQALNLLDSVNKFMTDEAKFKIISDLKDEADKEPFVKKNENEEGPGKQKYKSPWWKTIGETIAVIKGIQTLAQIPKAVDATYKKLSEMDKDIDVKSLVPKIVRMTKELVNQIGDGLDGINEIVMQSSMATVDKKTTEAMQTTTALLKSISDLVTTIVQAGEQMEEYGYRRLVHASIQIEFFIEILTNSMVELADSSQELIANTDTNERVAAQIQTAIKPITEVYETLQEMFGIIDGVKLMPQPLLKIKAKLLRNRIRNGIIIMNRILDELRVEIQKLTPDNEEKLEQFEDILEPIKNVFELVDIINKTPLPNMLIFKIRARMLRRRVMMVANLMLSIQAEINNIAIGNNNNTKAIRSVQVTVNAVKDMMEIFSTMGGIAVKLLLKGKFISPAINLIIKQLHLFDKLIDHITKLKDTKKANHKLRRMEEIVRSVAVLATTMVLLVPLLALFIIASPLLMLGILVFAGVMKLIVELVQHIATSKTALMILALTVVIAAFVVMAVMLLVLALVVSELGDAIGTIALFLFGVIVFLGILALLGLAVSFVWPFIGLAVLGVLLVTIAVGAILLIAICLKLLEFIDLDVDKIKENTKLILSTALDIMMLAFGPQSDPRGPNQDTSFLDAIGGAIVNIIRALAACIILVLTVISVVAILIIAAMLRILALINPKELEKGAKNAKLAIKTAAEIVDILFSDPETDEGNGREGFWGDLLTYVFEPLGKILKAVLAVTYLATLVIAMGMILLLTTMIRLIANFDHTKIADGRENAKLAVQAAAEIVADLFRADDSDRTPSDRGGLLCVVGYVFGKEFEDIIRAVLAIAYVGVLTLAMVMISFLAKELATIGKINKADLTKAKSNAALVVRTCGEIMNEIFSGDGNANTSEGEGEGWLKKMLKWVLPNNLMDMIDAMIKIGKLALLVIAVGAIGKLAEQLTTLAQFKVSSSQAKQKAKEVIGAASTLVVNLKSLSKDVEADEDDMSKMYDMCTGLSKIPAALQPVANNLTKLNQFKGSTIETAKLTGVKVITAMKEITEGVDGIKCDVKGVNDRLDILDRISKTIGSFVQVTDKDVKNSKNITENYIKFFKQVDSMDIKKLQHTDWLMRSWASISRDLKGNFEGLAKTINQHIMPMLEKVNETLDKTTVAQQDIIDALTQPVDFNMGGFGTPSTSVPDGSMGNNSSTSSGFNSGGGFAQGKADPTPASDKTPAPKQISGLPSEGIDPDDMKSGKTYKITIAKVTPV